MIELVAERGYHGVTIRDLAHLAGVSTRTFYGHFGNVDECFVYAYESSMRHARRQASNGRGCAENWEDGLRAGLHALMTDLAGHPKAARLALVDVFDSARASSATVKAMAEEMELPLVESFAAAPRGVIVPRHLVAGMVAGVTRVARTTSLAGRHDELPGLADELADWMLSLSGEHLVDLRTADPRMTLSGADSLGEITLFKQNRLGDKYGRLVAAAIKLGSAEGYSKLTIPKIRAEASVSRRCFEEYFPSATDCVLSAIEDLFRVAAQRAAHWARRAQSWEGKIYTQTLALCMLSAQNRKAARLALFEISASGRAGLIQRERLIFAMTEQVRTMIPTEERPSPVTAEASIAAAWHIVQADIAVGRANDLPKIAPVLAYVILAPIVGSRRASRAIHRQQAHPSAEHGPAQDRKHCAQLLDH